MGMQTTVGTRNEIFSSPRCNAGGRKTRRLDNIGQVCRTPTARSPKPHARVKIAPLHYYGKRIDSVWLQALDISAQITKKTSLDNHAILRE